MVSTTRSEVYSCLGLGCELSMCNAILDFSSGNLMKPIFPKINCRNGPFVGCEQAYKLKIRAVWGTAPCGLVGVDR
jgi:hypothetical protein